MNSTGRNKNSVYLVALLLVVGLAAFSNSMRELAEIQRFTLDTSRLIAHYIAPAEIPPTPQIPQVVVAKLGSCESRQAVPSVEPGVQLTVPAPPVKAARVAQRVSVKPTEFQLAKVNKLRQFEFHPVPFEFKVSSDDTDETTVQLPLTMFKARNRKQNNSIRLNTREREMILRTLNRSINLRTAS